MKYPYIWHKIEESKKCGKLDRNQSMFGFLMSTFDVDLSNNLRMLRKTGDISIEEHSQLISQYLSPLRNWGQL